MEPPSPKLSEALIIVDELYGRVFALPEGETLIGRSDCDINVPRGSTTPRHAMLRWENSVLSIEDLNSTNGTFVSRGAEDGATQRATGKVQLEVGDVIRIGIGKLVVRRASWLGEQPPRPLPTFDVDPTLVEAALAMLAEKAPTDSFSADVLDAAWSRYFLNWRAAPGLKWRAAPGLKWRAAPGPQPIFEAGARMCSADMLVCLRDAIDDPVRWFAGYGLDAVGMLAASDDPVGALLTLDVRLRHASRGFRETAGAAVRTIVRSRGVTISEFAYQQLEFADGLSDELQVRFAENAIESARKEGFAWPTRDFEELLGLPAFETAARSFVFMVRETEEAFRPLDGELLGLGGVIRLERSGLVEVAPSLSQEWADHLADYLVVQPFTQ